MLKRRLTEPFGKAGLIVACLALVAALGGTALAGKHLFTKAQEKQIAKIAKKYAGKPGAAGANGATGPQGNPGAPGKDGAAGANGNDGKNVELGVAASGPGEECEEGGVTVQLEGSPSSTKKYVCNGAEGPPGPQGSLQPGVTETGIVSGTGPAGLKGLPLTISFPIPLASAIPASNTVFVSSENVEHSKLEPSDPEYEPLPTGCSGDAEEPGAQSGFLCVFEANAGGNITSITFLQPAEKIENAGTSKLGTLASVSTTNEGPTVFLTWAVTG
ncbi:MAG TPA: hypothetical protein VFL77_04990 [Solirubrobacterales bacterium]|nr:hypothetical protein [Solirubrobacterales bacterium]